MAGGYINQPSNKYHLEIMLNNPQLARLAQETMNRFALKAKVREKKGRDSVYLKSSQAIGQFLTKIGAHFNLLVWENSRIVKEITNQANRQVNCESANLRRTTKAAQTLLAAIKHIESKVGLASLPPGLKEFALLRQAYPQASLKELGELAQPNLSKSAVSHRAQRLKQLAALLDAKV